MAKTRLSLKGTNTPATVPAFTVKVSAVNAEVEKLGFKEGDTLSEQRHIAAYFLAFIADPDQRAKAEKAGSVAIWTAVHNARVNHGMSDEDANEARMAAIGDADWMLGGLADVPDMSLVPASEYTNAQSAVTIGGMIDAETDKALTFAVEAAKDANAGFIVLERNLSRQFDKVKDQDGVPIMRAMPPVKSRYQGNVKSDKAPFGYRGPWEKDLRDDDPRSKLRVYNGPWDYYKAVVIVDGVRTEAKRHYVAELVASFGAGKVASDRVSHIKALLPAGSQGKAGCPDDILKHKGAPAILNGLLADATFEFGRRVREMTKAIRLYQVKAEIDDRFGDTIRVGLYGERIGDTPEAAVRRLKPFLFYQRTKDAKGEWNNEPSAPFTGAFLMGIEPRRFLPTAKVADLTAKKPRGKRQDEAKQEPGALAAEIATTDKLEEYLSAVSNYADKAENHTAIMKRVTATENGGKLASDIVGVWDLLAPIASNPDVRALAKAHDDKAARDMADAEKAKAKQPVTA